MREMLSARDLRTKQNGVVFVGPMGKHESMVFQLNGGRKRGDVSNRRVFDGRRYNDKSGLNRRERDSDEEQHSVLRAVAVRVTVRTKRNARDVYRNRKMWLADSCVALTFTSRELLRPPHLRRAPPAQGKTF